MPCKFNNKDAFEPERMDAHKEAIKLRAKLEKTKGLQERGKSKKGQWWLACDIQQIQQDLINLKPLLKPKLVET